jgi:gluconolactonase
VLAGGLGFVEGPVFTRSGEVVVTSMDRGSLSAVESDAVRIFAVTGGGPNGAAEGVDGTVYVTQSGGRNGFRRPVLSGGIQAVRPDGRLDWITQDPVSPNDLCFGPDGFLYVTDPTRPRAARDDGRLWRVDVETFEAELLVSTGWYPNGIGFGLEDDALYVSSTGDGRIMRFPLGPAGNLGTPEIVVQMDHNVPDGFAFDVDGNILVAAPNLEGGSGDLQVWDPNGALLELVQPRAGNIYTNVALSADRRLILTDARSGDVLVADGWPTAGLALHPFRA